MKKSGKQENTFELKNTYAVLIIFALILISFFNSFGNQFTFDDDTIILGNKYIKELKNIFSFFTGEAGFQNLIGRYYRPVVMTSYAIDYYFSGFNTFGYHLTNFLIHFLNCVVLYFVALEIFRSKKLSLTVSLFFAVYPVHTEAVTWISGRPDSLSSMFYLLSLFLYIKYSRNATRFSKLLFFSLIFFLLGLLSKEMAVTLPVILFLYEIILIKNSFYEAIKKTFLFFLIAIVFVLIRELILKDVTEIQNYLYFYGKSWNTVLLTMLTTITEYLRLLILPIKLLYSYNHVLLYIDSIFNFRVIVAIIIILFSFSIAFYFYKTEPIITFLIMWFFVTILPVMNIIPTMNLMAEKISLYSFSWIYFFIFSTYI
jgi:hypothetical protein